MQWDAYCPLVDHIPVYLPGGCICLGVGCTCPGGVPAQGCTCLGVYLLGGPGLGGTCLGRCTCPGGVPVQGGVHVQMGVLAQREGVYLPRRCTCPGGYLPLCGQADTCKNITFANFVCGQQKLLTNLTNSTLNFKMEKKLYCLCYKFSKSILEPPAPVQSGFCYRPKSISLCILTSPFLYQRKIVIHRRTTIKFSHNTQHWQCWHFCTTSNENKLEVFANEIHFRANVHLP